MKWSIILVLMVIGTLGCGQSREDRNELSGLLSQLDPSEPKETREKAIERLQLLGTNAFPFLIAEMNSFMWQTPQETDASVIGRSERLRAAFEVFGTNLVPLIDSFAENLKTDRNFVSAMDGFVAIGERGVPYLLEASTHPDSGIRLNAVAGILKLSRSNSDTASLSTPYLILRLKDESELVRSLSTETLGLYCADQSCLPALLEVVIDDPHEVVRSQAVKAIGRIQSRVGGDPIAMSVLEEVARRDVSQVVRRSAERVLSEGSGN